jgi:hypothetical protein
MEAIMRKNNCLIVGVAFATAMLAGAVIPVGGAQASVVYFEDFNNPGFRGTEFTAGNASDNNNDKYVNPDITFYQAANFDGWTFSNGNSGAAGPTFMNVYNVTGVDGAVLLNENDPGGFATTTVTTGLTANTQYQLSFLYYGDNRPGQIWGLHIDVNGSILDLSGTDQTAGTNPGSIATLLFLSDGVGQAVLSFTQTTLSGSEASPIIDNVTISETPIPATLPLFATGLGAFGLLGWRRKRKNAAARAAA